MSFTPISNTPPQYEENGIAASGYYIKFYESGTTTPTAMATDSTGTTLLDKCELDTEGYPINGSGAVFIPHINVEYKIALFRNAADADANDLNNAAWDVDGLLPYFTELSIGTNFDQIPLNADIVYPVANITTLIALTGISVGQRFQLDGYTVDGIGGSAIYDTVLTSSVTPNGSTVIASVANPSISFVERKRGQLVGNVDKKYQVVSGVLRNNGTGWDWILDSGHNNVGFLPTVTVVDGFKLEITSTVTDPDAKVVSLLATPDETFQVMGCNVGTSVGIDTSRIQFSFPLRFYFVGTTIAGNTDAHSSNVTIVNQNGRLEITHPIVGGQNGSRGPIRTVTSKWNGGPSEDLQVDHMTPTTTYVYAIAPLTAEIRYNGSTWDIDSKNFVEPITATFAGSLLTITHPSVSLDDIPVVSAADGSNLVPVINNRTATTTRILFRDYTGSVVTPEDTDMKISFSRGRARIDPVNASGTFHADQAVGYWDDVISNSANIWILGLVELNQ